LGEIITTGTANDSIYVATGTTGSANLTGGLGNDTYGFGHTTVNSSQITDTSGTDTLALNTGGASNIVGLNSGASLVASGIEQVVVHSTGVMTIATGQVTGAVAFNGVAGAALAITQNTVGTTAAPAVTSLASATFATFNYLDNAGTSTAGVAITSTTIIGTAGVDSIVGSTLADTITLGVGQDTVTSGGGADVINIATASAGSVAQVVAVAVNTNTIVGFDVITDLTTGTTAASKDKVDFAVAGILTGLANGVTDGNDGVIIIGTAGTDVIVSDTTASATGLISFFKTGGGAATIASDSDLAAVLSYLIRNDIGDAGATVVFNATYTTSTRGSTIHSYIYQQTLTSAANGNAGVDGFQLVDIVGVALIGVEAAASTTNLLAFIA